MKAGFKFGLLCVFNLLLAQEIYAADEPAQIENKNDSELVTLFKKNPDRLMEGVFYPKPYLCSTSSTFVLRNTGDKKGNPLRLSYAAYPAEVQSNEWRSWYDDLAKSIETNFSNLNRRADIGDRLLVIETSFVLTRDGKVSSMHVSPLCPGDFHSMILESIKEINIVPFPDKTTQFVNVHGRFVQNYGKNFLETKKGARFVVEPSS